MCPQPVLISGVLFGKIPVPVIAQDGPFLLFSELYTISVIVILWGYFDEVPRVIEHCQSVNVNGAFDWGDAFYLHFLGAFWVEVLFRDDCYAGVPLFPEVLDGQLDPFRGEFPVPMSNGNIGSVNDNEFLSR